MIVDLFTVDAGVAKRSRDVAGKSTYDAVAALAVGPIQEPHRAGILRWIHALTQARIGADLADEEAERETAEDETMARRGRLALEAEDGIARGPGDGAAATFAEVRDGRVAQEADAVRVGPARSYDEARRALVLAPNEVVLEQTLARMNALAIPVAAVRAERRLRRFEVSRRLGLAHPWTLAIDGGHETVAQLADAVLDATEPLSRDRQKRLGMTPARAIDDAFAREAREGWPARLNARWLEDSFRTMVPRAPKEIAKLRTEHERLRGTGSVGEAADGALPSAVGGASFLRAAADWGFAVRVASTARSLPYALARDPAPTEAFMFGDVLALAVASEAFAKRKLGLPARLADAHSRVLARASLFTLRQLAAIARLGLSESASEDEIEHLSARVFGRPLPRALGVAWANGGFSGRLRDDVAARLAATVRAYAFTADLVDRHDEDWFDNPRAASWLGNVAAGPVWQGDKPTGVDRIARAFEEALG